MIPLATATVVENLIATMSISNACKTQHDLTRCRIPTYFFERPIPSPSEWRGNAIFTVLVVVQAGGFLAEIPF